MKNGINSNNINNKSDVEIINIRLCCAADRRMKFKWTFDVLKKIVIMATRGAYGSQK